LGNVYLGDREVDGRIISRQILGREVYVETSGTFHNTITYLVPKHPVAACKKMNNEFVLSFRLHKSY